MSVDGTDCRIANHGRIFSSHKFNKKLGLCYEVGIGIINGNIVWINGPFPCGEWPDISIFHLCLQTFLDKGERVEADNGYHGNQWWVKCPANLMNPRENLAMQNHVHCRHETANSRLKTFAILDSRYRHEIETHGYVFHAVVVLVQLAIENCDPLFKVEYKM